MHIHQGGSSSRWMGGAQEVVEWWRQEAIAHWGIRKGPPINLHIRPQCINRRARALGESMNRFSAITSWRCIWTSFCTCTCAFWHPAPYLDNLFFEILMPSLHSYLYIFTTRIHYHKFLRTSPAFFALVPKSTGTKKMSKNSKMFHKWQMTNC